MRERLAVRGKLQLKLLRTGQPPLVRVSRNLVVSTGLSFITSRLLSGSAAVMSHMALGTGATAASLSDVALGSEVAPRKALSGAVQSGTNAVVYTAVFDPGEATGSLTEAGILNNSSGGTLLCRSVFAPLGKAAGDMVEVTWTITVSAGV